MQRALTIAGSDSGGGAGIQADLKTFAAFGVYGTSAITAITAQNTVAVTAIQSLPAEIVTAQIEAVASDIGTDAVKTGMLATAAIVEAVAAAIEALDLPNVVVDPVMIAKSGDRLLDGEAHAAMRSELFPKARVITPNIPEAAAFAGIEIHDLAGAREAARLLHRHGPRAVLVKGGHLPGDEVVDVLYDGHTFREFRGPRVAGPNTHGTGCSFASAIAAGLALGVDLEQAIAEARDYLAGAIGHGPAIGFGHRPLDHGWRQRTPPPRAL